MFTELRQTLESHLPARRKKTPSGWISFDAPCCHHNGETNDSRQRGGMMYQPDGAIQYHCFNCGFKTSYRPGRYLNTRFRKLLTWLNVSSSEIGKLSMKSMKLAQEISPTTNPTDEQINFSPASFPQDAKSITTEPEYISYLNTRGVSPTDYNFYYSSKEMPNRIIVPIVWNKIKIGYVARAIQQDTKPKYYANVQPGSLFNLDAQHWSRKYVILTEGVFDAIMIDGVAILGSEISNKQKLQIDALNRKVIVVPDRDKAGSKLINQACEWGWSVSMPPWSDGVKDINNAVIRYGKILTFQAILKYKHDTNTKIKLNEKLWI